MQNLLVEKPVDPIQFLIDQLKRDDDDVPKIIVLGPPASGKRSIARMICGKLRTAHLTPQSIIDEADTALKTQAQKYKIEDVPTELWVELVQNRMSLFDCVKKGWVMDSFPFTRDQAHALQAAGIYPKHCVFLEASDTVVIERAQGKRVDPKTGDVYHITFDWPSTQDIADRLQEVGGISEEDIVKRLVVYHRHIAGIVKCFEKTSKSINADQPKTDVFAQVMTFLSGKARSLAPHTPRVVLCGPTGSGKGVQATLLANKYNLVNVSMGQLIKQAITDEAKSGQACKPYVEKAMLVPDAIVLNILKDRLTQLDCITRGWVLHGYPKSREQAEQLAGAGLAPNRVLFLHVPNDSVLERLTLRATDPVTGDRYHQLYNPPHTQEVKGRLVTHPCDTEEEVRRRLTQYHAFSEEIQDYYTAGQDVNADQDPHTVFEWIESVIVNPLPKELLQ